MAKNRRIPFGYQMKNGEIVTQPRELYAVSKIFADYLKGKSLLEISRSMQEEQIPYHPGEDFSWNKNTTSPSPYLSPNLTKKVLCFCSQSTTFSYIFSLNTIPEISENSSILSLTITFSTIIPNSSSLNPDIIEL